MNTKLLVPTILFIFLSLNSYSQNICIRQGSATNWSNIDNRCSRIVPIVNDNVLIPIGLNVNANSLINIASLTVEGNSTLKIKGSFTFNNPLVFRQNITVNYFKSSTKSIKLFTNPTKDLISFFYKKIDKIMVYDLA